MLRKSVSKIKSLKKLKSTISRLKRNGKKIVFTNGCFDIIHTGHVSLFEKAKSLGDVLVIGVNSDASVKRLKGNKRPIVKESARAKVLASMEPVDFVSVFTEDTPYKMIEELKPNILVKGSDYKLRDIVGAALVGKVYKFKLVKGYSTSYIIERIKKTCR